MDELIAFLTRMLDADEAAAAVVVHEYSSTWKPVTVLGASDVTEVVDLRGFPVSPGGIGVVGEHIARYDPARALREVAAKRARLALMIETTAEMNKLLADEHAGRVEQAMAIGRARAATMAVKHDASVYSGEPGYKAEWVP